MRLPSFSLSALFGKSSPPARVLSAAPPEPDYLGESQIRDAGSAIAFGNRIILLGIGSFLLWAFLVPIDEGIPATGSVVVESRRKTITHLSGGTLTHIYVRENQRVESGQVLLAFDATKAEVALNTVLQEYVAASAKQARLSAEQVFDDRLRYSDELVNMAREAGRNDALRAQEQLFRVRRQTFEAEQAILRENLQAAAGQASGTRLQLAAKREQAAILQQEMQGIRPMVEEGLAPRNRLWEQERQVAELSSATSDLQARVIRDVSTGNELRLRQVQRRQEFLRDVESQLADSQREVANLKERLRDARADLDRMVVKAPATGQVVSLQAQSPGIVITPGTKIMEIVPEGDKLVLEVQVPVHLIDRIRPGLETDVRFAAFPDLPQMFVEGKVQSISADRFEPPAMPPYYLARIEVTEKGLAILRDKHLRPGMPADAVIKTGERSFATYLINPLRRKLASAFQEP